MTCLDKIPNALLTVSSNVGHHQAMKKSPPYIVWAEDSQADAVYADGELQEQSIQGTIDCYTKTENDPAVESIQGALNDAEIYFRLNSIQREDDTGYIHYEWVFEVE